ncbi:hypothetical protein [Fangia hongkongensis]|uniref:hypothetical protein n=1 Tax=Fangia hongkongensis TaxID=270495 RepID=UPI00037E7495|nr:hypothetical protein [Fangia hongkongensis]MBK2125941.1 hypothetical protein [Fangia hongkongensis]
MKKRNRYQKLKLSAFAFTVIFALLVLFELFVITAERESFDYQKVDDQYLLSQGHDIGKYSSIFARGV